MQASDVCVLFLGTRMPRFVGYDRRGITRVRTMLV